MSEKNNSSYEEALNVAASYDISTPVSSIVLYSISYQATDKNLQDAIAYVAKTDGKLLIEDTLCGKKLIELGFDYNDNSHPLEQRIAVWKVASERFVEHAQGDVTAFVDGADKRSVFLTAELPELLNNPKVSSINGIDKYEFANSFI